jgi:arylsulfatase
MTAKGKTKVFSYGPSLVTAVAASADFPSAVHPAQAADKRPKIVMLMTDDTGWNDFGCYSGEARTSVIRHRMSIASPRREPSSLPGTARRAALPARIIYDRRIPIRSALSIVVARGDENRLRKETPTIAEFFQKNGYTTYFSGKWHLGDKPDAYTIEHGFDEMKHFAAYYAGVYSYNDTSKWFHPWFPSYNPEYKSARSQVRRPDRQFMRISYSRGRMRNAAWVP